MDYKEKWRWYDLNVNNRLISDKAKKKFLEQWERDEAAIKLYQKKKRRERTIRKNIRKKRLNWYVTLTINPGWKDRTDLKRLQKGIRTMFERYEIDYYLVPELHSDGVSYHFHGFVGSENMELFEKSGHKDRYHNEVYHLKPFQKNYGFSACVRIDRKSEWQQEKIIKYVAMYMVKDNVRAMSSRSNFALKRLVEETRSLLGDLVKIEA